MIRTSEITLMGEKIPLVVDENPQTVKISTEIRDNVMHVTMNIYDVELLNQALKRHYTRLLRTHIDSIISEYSSHFKLKPKSVTIESSFNKWGSCNHLRELRFNWKLSIMSKDIIEYVVVHELCHMVHLNHDRSFWRLVGKLYPNYKTIDSKLNNS